MRYIILIIFFVSEHFSSATERFEVPLFEEACGILLYIQ